MTAKVTPENEWAGAQLRARREKLGLTQAQVAEAAGINRELYVNIEAGRRKVTMTYAERLAGPLKARNPKALLPPPPPATEVVGGPLDRLAELEAALADRQHSGDAFAQEVVERLARIEAALGIAALPSARQESEPRG